MNQQHITFNNMTSDVAPKYMKEGSYIRMKNARPNNLNSGSGGVVENINSNLPISNLGYGETVGFIGACQDNKRSAIISFYAGLTTLHIVSYSVDTQVESYVLKTNEIDFSRRVTHAGVMDDYLFWIDGEYNLRKFNLNDSSSSLNSTSAKQLLIDKAPPLYPPSVVASYDNSNISNNINNTIFQYAYSYQYKDNEQSSWSPISKSIVPASTDDEDKNFPNNLHTITLKTGSESVSKILIAARKGEDRDFLLVDTIDKEEEGILDNTTYDYLFYNSKATVGLTQADVITNTFNPYHYFKTMAIANDNFLALGGVKDGLEGSDVSLSLGYTVSTSTERQAGFKMGATHELGLVFRDDNGRTSGVTASTTLDIPSLVGLNILGLVPLSRAFTKINWSVSGSAPSWAKTMSVVYLGNTTMSYHIRHLVGNIYDRQDYTYIDISPLNLASQQGSTTDITASEINIEPYTWQQGDRIRFLTNNDNVTLLSEIDLEVKGYVPQKTDSQGNILYAETIYVDKFDWSFYQVEKYAQYEIYRPKKDFTDKIYYETGNVYEVINGVIQTTSGTISEGDIWHRERSHDTRRLGELSVPSDFYYSEYQGSDIVFDLSALGDIDGLQNSVNGSPFYRSPEDTTITLSGSFKFDVQWDKDFSQPAPKFRIDRPGSNNNESIDIPYTFTSKPATADWLSAGTISGTIDYEDIDMPEGSTIYFQIRVINKHRVEIQEGSNIFFNILVQNEEDKFVDFYVEDINYSDYFDSDEHSKGRPYTELDNDNQNRLLNNIVTTGKFFADTDSDETNKIDEAVTYIPYKHGEIEALRIVGDVLKAITPTKEISCYLGREQYVDGAGNVQTSLSSTKIGRINVPIDDYGTINPESIMIDGRSMYYYDSKNAAIVSSNPNGRLNIADYGLKTRLREITGRLKSASDYNVHIGYNDKNEEVICSFVYDGTEETIVFNERDNIWTHELEQTNGVLPVQGYSYYGETCLEYIGKPYVHEQGNGKLTFFGDAKEAEVVGVMNQNPVNTKVLQSMSYQSTDKWDVTIHMEEINTHPFGMETIIPQGRQQYREGIVFSDIPKNLMGKDGSINKLKYATGIDMRGRYGTVTMTNSNTSPVQLDVVTINYIASPTQ